MLALLIGASVQGAAQSAGDSTKQLNEVVITAAKFPKSIHETGKVLTVIDRAQLQREEGKSLAQILNDQAGLSVNGANSNPGKDKSVFLQGAGSKYTLILIDGIPAYDASSTTGDAFDLRLLTADQTERIEILKGSQSTLYGTDAIAGVINIITRKNGNSAFGGSASANYGTHQTFNANAMVTGKAGKIGYLAGYSRQQSKGISEAIDEKNAGFDRDGFFGNFFNASLNVALTPKLSLTPFFRSTFFHGKFDAGSFADDLTNAYNSQFYNYGARLQLTLPNTSVYYNLSQNTADRQYSLNGANTNYNGIFNQSEIFANHALGKHVSLAGGASLQQMYMKNEQGVNKNPAFNLSSPYLALHLMKLGGFAAEIGGRYAHHSKGWSAFTYSLNPSYRIKESAIIFFNYSTGFKTPTLSDLYGPWGGNENLKPEKSKSIEAGAQVFLKKDMNVRVVFFNRRTDDLIVPINRKLTNINSQRDRGAEAEARVKLNRRISLGGFYAFATGELLTASPATKRDTAYYNLFRRPKHMAGLNLACQATEQISFNWSLKTFSRRTDLFYVNRANNPVDLSAYQLLDAHISYGTKNKIASFFVSAKNILNQNYMEVYGYSVLRFTLTVGSTIKF